MEKLKRIFPLFATFFKIGLFTFGGGYAMISLIEEECVNRHDWMSHEEMADMLAIAESTPGPISINCATYIGFKQAGILGAIMTTLGVVLPSFCIILLIANFFDNFLAIPLVAAAFRGIQVAVSILIFRVGIRLVKKAERRPFPLCLLIGSILLMAAIDIFSLPVSTIYVILAAVLLGLASSFIPKKGGKEK